MAKYWSLAAEAGLAHLILERPELNNTINPDVVSELRSLCEGELAGPEIRVVLLSGRGRHFSAGMDTNLIKTMPGADPDELARGMEEMQAGLDALETLNKPVIALIQGFCIGAGMLIAACADVRLADDRSYFSMPEVRMGIGVTMGAGRLVRLMGVSLATEIMLLGERFGARQALSYGFLNRVFDSEDLHVEALRIAERFARLPGVGTRTNKVILSAAARLDPQAAMRVEVAAQLNALADPELKQALSAYRP